MNQGEKLEDLDEYTTLLEFTPENQVIISYIQQDLIQEPCVCTKTKTTQKIVKITLRWQKKMQKTVKMSP